MKKLDRIQYRIWLDSEFQDSKSTYNLCSSAKITGKLCPYTLQKSLAYCIQRYDILHSVIVQDSEGFPYWDAKDQYDIPYHYIPADGMSDEEMRQCILNEALRPLRLKEEFPCHFSLYRLSPECHVFFGTFHHCMMDGYGILQFSGYLSRIYNALRAHQDITQISAPAFFELKEIAEDSETRTLLQHEGVAEICKYLKDVPFNTSMPFDAGNSQHQTSTFSFEIGAALLQQCTAFCRQSHHSLFHLFSACWGIVMCRMLNTCQIVFDHVANISSAAEKETLGARINNQPLLIDLTKNPSLMQLLDSIHQGRRLLNKYSFVDYLDLLSEFRRRASGTYHVPNLVINYPIPTAMVILQIEGCHAEPFYWPVINQAETLGLHIYDNDQATCMVVYQDFVPTDFVQELSESFKALLSRLIQSDLPACEYELITAHRRQAIIDHNQVEPFSITQPFFRQLIHHVQHCPDYPAIVCQSQTLSYAEFCQLTDSIARYILPYKSEKDPFRVAICMDRSLYTLPIIIGALKAGATYIPIDASLPQARIAYILHDSQAQLFITEAGTVPPADVSCHHIIVEELLPPSADTTVLPDTLPSIPYIIYTSGTTGTPKATPISSLALHQLVHNIIHHNRWIDHCDVVLQMASISFDASVVDIFASLYAGATIVVATERERKDINLLCSLLQREKVTFATIPPAVMAILPVVDLHSMKTMVFAGESTPKKVFDRWLGRGIRIVNAYGPTENTVCSTFADIDENTPHNNIGLPLRNVSCYVLDQHMHLQPFGCPGELYLGGNQVTDGYLNQPELNAKKFVPNPFATDEQKRLGVNCVLFKTGDTVILRPDFSMEFIGRIDLQVKLNGYRIELEEIEHRLQMHPAVDHAVCAVNKTENNRSQLVAYVSAKDAGERIDIHQLSYWLSETLPEYMVPTKWAFVQGFKLTANGKIDRRQLPADNFIDVESEQSNYVAPATASEHLLASIFAKVLEVEHVSVTADLFQTYGLESIQVMTAIYEANRQGIAIAVSTFFKNKTIRGSLRDNRIYPYYWYEGNTGRMPVIIIVCGLVYLHPYHDDLLELIKDRYDILILDSIHEYFFMKQDCTYRRLLNHYMEVLPDLLKGRNVFGVTGWCIGGEIALQLAVELKQAHVASPIVFSLDGYLHYNMEKNAPLFAMNFLNQPEEVNRERDRIKEEFAHSAFFRPYSGKVFCFFADEFSKYPPNGEILSDEEVEFNYRSFLENPADWQKMQPGCVVQFLHDNHYTFLQRKNMIEVVKVMDEQYKLENQS